MSVEAMRKALNYIENTEGELGIKLSCGDALRDALAAQPPAAPVTTRGRDWRESEPIFPEPPAAPVETKCEQDDCPHPDCLVNGLCPSQPPRSSAGKESDPFRRAEVEAICRAVCKVEGVDPDGDTLGDGCDPVWTRYADAVFSALVPTGPQAVQVTEEEIGDLLADTSDNLGPGCDETAFAQALLRTYSITRPEPQPAPHPDETVNFNGRLVTWAEIDAAVRKRNAALSRPEPQGARK